LQIIIEHIITQLHLWNSFYLESQITLKYSTAHQHLTSHTSQVMLETIFAANHLADAKTALSDQSLGW